jgi:hypothetical protein
MPTLAQFYKKHIQQLVEALFSGTKKFSSAAYKKTS